MIISRGIFVRFVDGSAAILGCSRLCFRGGDSLREPDDLGLGGDERSVRRAVLSSWSGGNRPLGAARPPGEGFAAPAVEVLEGALVLLRSRGDDSSEAIAFSFAINESSLELTLLVLEGSSSITEGTVAVGTGERGAASRNICHSSISPGVFILARRI